MSYRIDLDGPATFTCNGCKRETTVPNSKQLPRGWCVVGILEMAPDPELGEERERVEANNEDLHDIGALVGAHYHTAACGNKALRAPKVAKLVTRLKIALALYGQCHVVVDGTGGDVGAGRSEHHDVTHDDSDRDDKPKGKHPRFKMGGEAPPI